MSKHLIGRNSQFRRSVFLKIFVSLMGLTLIPIVILGLTSYFVFYRSMKAQSDDFDRMVLSTLTEKIDRDLEEIREILFRYSLFMDIEQENYARLLGVVRELGGIAGTNRFVEDIFIYIIDSERVLTQNGLYYADVFFDKVYRYANPTGTTFRQRLREQNTFRILSTADVIQDSFIDKRYLTILNSVPIRERPRANLVVLVEEAALRDRFDATGFVSRGDRIAIVNSSLELIAGSIEKTLDLHTLKEILTGTDPEALSVVHDDYIGDHLVFHSRSSMTDWHYMVFTPANQITKQAASIRNITIWICAALIIISLLLTWIISLNLYTPIREIVATLQDAAVEEQEPAYKSDEMSYILNHVKYVMERNKSLDDTMKQAEPAFRDQYLRSLILGIPNRVLRTDDFGARLDWPFTNFAVLVIQISFLEDAGAKGISRDSMTNELLRYFEEVLEGATGLVGVITYIGKSRMTVLVNLQSSQTLGLLLQEIEPQVKRFSEKHRCSIALGIGDTCRAVSQINRSYEEALNALRSRKMGAAYQILHYDRTDGAKKLQPRLSYPNELERQLTYHALAGNRDRVEETINNIIAQNLLDQTTYNHMITLFDKFVNTAGKILGNASRGKLQSEYNEFLTQFHFDKPENLGAMRRSVLNIYRQITEALSQHHKGTEEELKEKLVRYIGENYQAPNLSLDRIAAEFDLNPKYISRYFKEKTGTNYIDYLNMIRINQAKELLLQHDKLKIMEIAKSVGFYNVNTFIAAFKRLEGVTPNAFRKHSRV
jgi:AraC-like DNA-binding protein